MKIWKYQDYNEYIQTQVEVTSKKLDCVYVEKKTIDYICKDLKDVQKILCHGTRNGIEQKYFQQHFPDAEIIGTDIADVDAPMTVKHDFNRIHLGWYDQFDILYSNSFDHSFDPRDTIKVWRDQIHSKGKIYIEHSYGEIDNRARPSDPLEINNNELVELFENAGLCVEDVFEVKGFDMDWSPSRLYTLTKSS